MTLGELANLAIGKQICNRGFIELDRWEGEGTYVCVCAERELKSEMLYNYLFQSGEQSHTVYLSTGLHP
jgi:hypothetical protein